LDSFPLPVSVSTRWSLTATSALTSQQLSSGFIYTHACWATGLHEVKLS
jgi:hypothetical protein